MVEVELKSWLYLPTQDLCRDTRAMASMLMKITPQVCGVVKKLQEESSGSLLGQCGFTPQPAPNLDSFKSMLDFWLLVASINQ